MYVLHLDLTTDATRDSILKQLKDALGEEVADVEAIANNADLPDHYQYSTLADISEAIDNLDGVTSRAKGDMLGVYRILAEAEGRVHGCSKDEVHFHEVGSAESVNMTLEICISFRVLALQTITATPVQLGSGQVQTAHGLLDIPTPATSEILRAHKVPVCEKRLEGELCTPTSAAIIAYFVDEFDKEGK